MKNRNQAIWTSGYTLLNVCYFAAFCTVHAYAAVFLLSRGFTNTQVGILLATANITSALFQPYIAGVIDRGGWLTNRRFILISCLVILAGSIILRFIGENMPVIFIIFALIYMIQFAYQPVMTALCFEYQKKGCDIYYGLARGLGSAGFAVTSAFIGKAVEERGASLLMTVTACIMAVSAVAVFFYRPSRQAATPADEDIIEEVKTHNNIKDFFRTYPAFFLFAIATVFFFFAHNMINDFMIQIIRSLGGAETELGYSNFLQAILELPVMALIGIVMKKVSAQRLLVFSGIAFFVKILILVFATNIVWMFISQGFQLFAYAVFIPASAYYVSETMTDSDQVKGQAFFTSAITIGGVFSNLISGFILDHLGMKPMLIIGTVVCLAGVLVAFTAAGKMSVKILGIALAALTALSVVTGIVVSRTESEGPQKEPRVIMLSIDAPDNIPIEQKERIVYDSLITAGYSPAGACGMMGNIAVESPEFDPSVINESSGAFGLFQWTDVGDRQQRLKDFCREHSMNWGSIEGQIAFAVYELSGADPIACRLDDFLKETDDPYAASAEFTAGFERCIMDGGKSADRYAGSLYPEFYGQCYQGMAKRINKSMNYYERFKDDETDDEHVVNITIEQ